VPSFAQRTPHRLVDLGHIEPLRFDVATAPAHEMPLLLDFVGFGRQEHTQEFEVAVRPADILRRAAARAHNAGRRFRRWLDGEQLLQRDGVAPVVAVVVDVLE
jgi:hypothetical protein